MFYAPRHNLEEFMELHDVNNIIHELRTELFEGNDPYDPDGRQISNLLARVSMADDDEVKISAMAELEDILLGLDFSDEKYAHYRPGPDDVQLKSYVGRMCSGGTLESSTKKGRIVKLVTALHYKTVPQEPDDGRCPICQRTIFDGDVCETCGTKIATWPVIDDVQKNIDNMRKILAKLDPGTENIDEAKRLVENLLAWACKARGQNWVRPTTQAGIDVYLERLDTVLYGQPVDPMDSAFYTNNAREGSIMGQVGNSSTKKRLLTYLLAAHFQLQPHPIINDKCPCCKANVGKGQARCHNCDAMLETYGQSPEIDQRLKYVMVEFTKKGHVKKLLETIEDDDAKAMLERLKASSAIVSPVDGASQFYSDNEIEDMLEGLLRHVVESEPSNDVLNHLDALLIKIRGVHKIRNDTCPVCGQRTRDKYECPACRTNFVKARKETNMPKPKISFKAAVVILIIVALLAAAITCVQVIPAGSTGIRVTMGKVDQNLVPPGPTFKLPFVQSIKTVNNKQQTYTFPDKIWGESSEQTVVYMENVAVSYQIMPEYSVWLYSNVTDYQNNALPPALLSSAMKAAMVELGANDVTNRAKIEPIALQKLQDALDVKYDGNEVVHVTSVNINNMDFEDNYNQAIEQRQIAQLEYEKQQIAIKTQLEKAEADKTEREIKANAAAKEKEIQADAEAKSIKAVADAQAEANEKLARSLTKDLVEYRKVEKWDGKVPQVSGGNAIIDMRDESSTPVG